MTVEVPADSIAELAAREDVAYISPDREVHAEMDVTRETTGAARRSQTGAARRRDRRSVGIAIIDSGISAQTPTSSDGATRVVAAVDFTGAAFERGNGTSAGDQRGHGAGVAGVAAGGGAASAGYAGNYADIAPSRPD